ncbi:MAG: acetyltransferase [Chthoniobacter sp.]|nr:acetyltransferase [Chthoniobacter sp.]
MTRIVGIGAGGHAEVILDILQQSSELQVVALVDANPKLHGSKVAGVPVIGGDDQFATLRAEGVTHAFFGIAGFGANNIREQIFQRVSGAGFKFVNVVHPSAVVSKSAELGEGTVVFVHGAVNVGARVGVNVIINTAASVDHHCIVGDHSHLAPGARLAGGVRLGAGVQVGMGALIRENVTIGDHAVIGAGAIVLNDVPAGMRAFGVPARLLPPK